MTYSYKPRDTGANYTSYHVKGPNSIKVTSLHVSCKSDKFDFYKILTITIKIVKKYRKKIKRTTIFNRTITVFSGLI